MIGKTQETNVPDAAAEAAGLHDDKPDPRLPPRRPKLLASRWHFAIGLLTLTPLGVGLACTTREPPYPIEARLRLAAAAQQAWAVAPSVNLSGQRGIDPLLQADALYQEVQNVRGVTAIPVNRVAEAYASLGIGRVETPEQAQLVCELLSADALLVPTITIWDPYDPPKIGAAVQLFPRGGSLIRPGEMSMDDVRALSSAGRIADPIALPELPRAFAQEAGMYDASHGSVRAALATYAKGRNDPDGPAAGVKRYLLSMDRYGRFVYHELLYDLLRDLPRGEGAPAGR